MNQDSALTELYLAADLDGSDSDAELTPLYNALEAAKVRYTEGPLIGKGGMKEIINTYDSHTERHVALARPRNKIGPERYDAFLREAHITSRLEHPNIIKLFDMGLDEEKRPFFTMEFKRGHSLRKILSSLRKGKNQKDYPIEKRLQIVLRICEAMAYAHSRHVLHLDLKPENIQVGTFGEVQVCDWGMGEIERGQSSDHLSEALLDPDLYGDQLEPAIKGTPGYMAPEQKERHGQKSARTDIFALGCLLYEVVSLRLPNHREEQPPSSPAIAAIVKKACHPNPENRYASAELLGQDVERHLAGHSPEVHNAGFWREARLFLRRNKLPCFLTLTFTLFLLSAGIYFTQELRESNEATGRALTRAENSLVLAETQRTSAQNARTKAEESLARYKRERDYASALLSTREGSLADSTAFVIHNLMMKESISLPALENAFLEIDRELEKNPPKDDRAWSLKGHLLFMTQRFNEAKKFYAIDDSGQSDLNALTPEFGPLVRKNGLLTSDDLVRLLNDLSLAPRDRQPLSEKIVLYDSLKRKSPIETARFIETLLRFSNPKWTHGAFNYDPEKKHLSVGGNFFRSFYRRGGNRQSVLIPTRPLIRLIPLESLNLNNTRLHSFWHLEGLTLRRLDIRGHTPQHLEALAEFRTLRELIILPGQLSDAELKQLPSSIKVIEEPR